MPSKDQRQMTLYPDGFDIHNEYHFEPGVCILPIAEDPPTDPDALKAWSPVAVLRLHAPYRIRKQQCSGKKTNNPPVMPAPKDVGKFVFVGGGMSIANGLNTTNANFNWLVNSEYVFVEDCVSRNQDGFVLGVPPFDTIIEEINATQFAIPISNLPSGIGPEYGAVASAGSEAQVGYIMGQNVFSGPTTVYGYNNRSFYPGTFLDDNMSNN